MKHLIVGAGGSALYAFFGAICSLHNSGHLDDLEEVSGASAGSLASLMYLAGKTKTQKTIEHLIDLDIKEHFKINPLNLVKKLGLIDIKKVRKLLSELCENLFGFSDISFKELFDLSGVCCTWLQCPCINSRMITFRFVQHQTLLYLMLCACHVLYHSSSPHLKTT